MANEVWKTYKYSDYCIIEVSNFGNIKKDGRQLIKRINHDGYLVVGLNKGKNKNGHDDYRSIFIHRLVLCAFVDERFYKEGWEANHKDYNRQNNCLDNLQLLCPNCHALTNNWRGRNQYKTNPPTK